MFSFEIILLFILFNYIENGDSLISVNELRYRKQRPGCSTKVIADPEVAYQISVKSVLTCAAHCGEDVKCLSFNHWLKNCQISWTHLDTTCSNGVIDLSKIYYETMCLNGGYFENGKCRCVGGYIGQYCERIMEDCTEGAPYYPNEIGKFLIHPRLAPAPFSVMCRMDFDLRTYLQRHKYGGGLSFNESWNNYKNGFGQLTSWNFWLGNQNIYYLTQSRKYFLIIQLTEKHYQTFGQFRFNEFRVASEADMFRMSYTTSMRYPLTILFDDCLYYVNGANFTTFDRDNDESDSNCALIHGAGFWYENCTLCNPNGKLWPGGDNQTIGDPTEFFWHAGLPGWSAWAVAMWLSR